MTQNPQTTYNVTAWKSEFSTIKFDATSHVPLQSFITPFQNNVCLTDNKSGLCSTLFFYKQLQSDWSLW